MEDGTETVVDGTKTTTYDFDYNETIDNNGAITTVSLYDQISFDQSEYTQMDGITYTIADGVYTYDMGFGTKVVDGALETTTFTNGNVLIVNGDRIEI